MQLIPLTELTFDSTNIPNDTTPIWDVESGYAKGTKRQLNNKIYEALKDIGILSTYIYDDTDPLNPHYTVRVLDDVVMTNTAVPCV